MKQTFAEIEALSEAGIIGKSAMGGAMAATFYLEPVSTFDIDIFVLFENAPLILTLTPIYDFLKARGHEVEGDAIRIHRWPVQFLPAESPLLKEAVLHAQRTNLEGVPVHVMTAEHLMAIAVQTGRPKDYARLLTFVEAGVADPAKLDDILRRHALLDAWQKFESKFLPRP